MDDYLASRSYRDASLKQRRSIIGRFLEVSPPVEDVTPQDVLAWWAGLEDLAPATRRAYLQAVRGYMRWLVDMGRLEGDPTACIRMPTVHRKPPRTLTQGEVELLRAAPMAGRERLIIGLMLDLGLRVGEVAAVAAVDVLDGPSLVVHGKGGKESVLPLPAHLAALMPSEGRLVDCTGSALSRRVKTLLRRCGLGHRTAHDLRRTAATLWAQNGVPPHVISHLLRHSSLATSAHYVAVSDVDLRAAVA